MEIEPLKVGGSGTHSYDRHHPARMPERLEAGTLNAHGIAGLSAGLAYIEERGVEELGAQVRALAERFERGVRGIDGVRVLGGGGDAGRCGIVALNVGDADSAAIGDALNAEFGICTRGGSASAASTPRTRWTPASPPWPPSPRGPEPCGGRRRKPW